MLELITLPILVIGIALYVTWVEIRSNRPFKLAVTEGLVSGIALTIIFYCINAGAH